jgi:rubrerythrin
MNDDLISRADAIAFIERGFKKTSTVKSILCYLATVKSAESDDIGKWIKHEDYNESIKYGCNRCGNLTNIPSNYCPNCGKAMKKGGRK